MTSRLPIALAGAMLLALILPGWQQPAHASANGPVIEPVMSPVEPPTGTESFAVQWGTVAAPGDGVMLLAVARPSGTGPFPAVVVLHGSHGFAHEYVRLAEDLARQGQLAVAACWFSGGRGAGSRFITPISCPEGTPPMSAAASPEAMATVDALVRTARALPDARPDRIALFGHSRGGGAAVNYVLRSGAVQAVVVNSAGYPRELAALSPQARAPVLILHGTADSPADGGSEFTNVQMARAFEAALRRAGKLVEAKYYQGGSHNGIFTSSAQYDDGLQRTIAFLRQHLHK